MRSLLILGAADGALSTYRVAASMGYRTIAVDRSPSSPGVALADEFLPISTRDAEAILSAIRERTDIAGVLAPSSDVAVPTQRTVAAALGLPGQLSPIAARASLDKWVLRGILDDLGVSSYPWLMGDDPLDVAARAATLRFPVVVKPADAQSGRGVTRCTAPDEVQAAAVEAHRYSYGGVVMVEEEIPGELYNCECVIDGGRMVFAATSRQTLSEPPRFLTMRRDMPGRLSADVESTIKSIVDKVCVRLEYQQGPLNIDLIVTPAGEPFLIEAGLRTGGNGTDDMARLCYGVDPIETAVSAAVGRPVAPTPHEPRPVRWQVLTAPVAGELTAISGEAAVRAMPDVARLELLVRPGQQVREYADVADRLGWFVVHAETPEELQASTDRVLATLQFHIGQRDA